MPVLLEKICMKPSGPGALSGCIALRARVTSSLVNGCCSSLAIDEDSCGKSNVLVLKLVLTSSSSENKALK